MKKFLSLFLILSLMLVGFPVLASAAGSGSDAVATASSVHAKGFCLMDAESGIVLSQSNQNLPLPMASTTKVMTCLVALERANVSDEVVISAEAVGVEGSSVYLQKGEKLTLLDLLYALMLESANDAAVAIALHVAPTVEVFSDYMNQKASELGMLATHYVNPHGLPADGHYSCARDLAILFSYALKNAAFSEIVGTKTKTIPATEGHSRYLSNHNRLLRTYESCIGGKTGYTKEAGRCLVTGAKRDGTLLVCATLGASDDWNAHKTLYEYGFSLYREILLADSGQHRITIPVVGATVSEVAAVQREPVKASIREGDRVSVYYEAPPFLYASGNVGDRVGYAVFCIGDREIARTELVLESTLERSAVTLNLFQRILQWIRLWF